MYAVMINDYYLYFANCFGIVIGLFCSSSAMMLLLQSNGFKPTENERKITIRVEILMIGGVTFWIFMILIVGIILQGANPSKNMIGILCDIISIGYYAAPLSTIYIVIKTGDTSSLHVPTILANLMNAIMWFVYGLAGIQDLLVWLPNGLGVLLAMLQLAVILTLNPSRFCCHSNSSSKVPVQRQDSLDTNTLKHKDFALVRNSSKEEQKHNETPATDVENHQSTDSTSIPSKTTNIRNIMAGWRTASVIR